MINVILTQEESENDYLCDFGFDNSCGFVATIKEDQIEVYFTDPYESPCEPTSEEIEVIKAEIKTHFEIYCDYLANLEGWEDVQDRGYITNLQSEDQENECHGMHVTEYVTFDYTELKFNF